MRHLVVASKPLFSFRTSAMDSASQAESKKSETKWSSADEATLVEVLKKAQAEGLQSESGWKPTVWARAEEALRESSAESGLGGAPKTEKPIKSRWQRVSIHSLILIV